MTEQIGVFTPQQAYDLWQFFLKWRNYNPTTRRQTDEPRTDRVLFKNATGETIPAFACMQITGVELVGERCALTVEKPSEELADYLINSHFDVEAGDQGYAFRYGAVLMLGDEPDEPWRRYKPVVDSWELEEGPGPFLVFGRHDVSDRALIGRIEEWPDVDVVTDQAVAASEDPLADNHPTFNMSVLRRTSEGGLEDTGKTLKAVNRNEHIDLAAEVKAVVRRVNREWRLISADCSALSEWPR